MACVEVDFSRPLKKEIRIMNGQEEIIQQILYPEPIPSFYNICGKFGHVDSSCSKNPNNSAIPMSSFTPSEDVITYEEQQRNALLNNQASDIVNQKQSNAPEKLPDSGSSRSLATNRNSRPVKKWNHRRKKRVTWAPHNRTLSNQHPAGLSGRIEPNSTLSSLQQNNPPNHALGNILQVPNALQQHNPPKNSANYRQKDKGKGLVVETPIVSSISNDVPVAGTSRSSLTAEAEMVADGTTEFVQNVQVRQETPLLRNIATNAEIYASKTWNTLHAEQSYVNIDDQDAVPDHPSIIASDNAIDELQHVTEDLNVHPMQDTHSLNNLEENQNSGYFSVPELDTSTHEDEEMITITADWNQIRVPSSTLKEKNVRTRSKSKNLHLQMN
jgi:hypothetical protein